MTPGFPGPLLGGFEVRLPSGIPVHLPTRKAQALLAYLAMRPGQAHPRDKLAAPALGRRARRPGPRQPPADAEPHRQGARRAPVALSGGRRPDDRARCRRRRRRRGAIRSGGGRRRRRRRWSGRSQLYRGDLLEGLVLDEAAFEAWLLSERERLREIVIEALLTVLAHHQAPGRLRRARHPDGGAPARARSVPGAGAPRAHAALCAPGTARGGAAPVPGLRDRAAPRAERRAAGGDQARVPRDPAARGAGRRRTAESRRHRPSRRTRAPAGETAIIGREAELHAADRAARRGLERGAALRRPRRARQGSARRGWWRSSASSPAAAAGAWSSAAATRPSRSCRSRRGWRRSGRRASAATARCVDTLPAAATR